MVRLRERQFVGETGETDGIIIRLFPFSNETFIQCDSTVMPIFGVFLFKQLNRLILEGSNKYRLLSVISLFIVYLLCFNIIEIG